MTELVISPPRGAIGTRTSLRRVNRITCDALREIYRG